jgi:NDP-sugar pyrophosphorylase family protein
VNALVKSGKAQPSVMEVYGPGISEYGVVTPKGLRSGIFGLIEKPAPSEEPSNLASIGHYILTPDVFETKMVDQSFLLSLSSMQNLFASALFDFIYGVKHFKLPVIEMICYRTAEYWGRNSALKGAK